MWTRLWRPLVALSAVFAGLVASATAASSLLPQFLDDFSVEQVGEWLKEHKLDRAFGEQFEDLQYDGDVLANFLQPHEVSLADFPSATKAHVAKLFDRIGKASRSKQAEARRLAVEADGEVTHGSAATTAHRRLASSNGASAASGSGIRILHNNSAITMGEKGDVTLRRGGPDQLATEDDLYVHGVDVLRLAAGLSGGGVAWDFSHPAARHFLRSPKDLTLPPHFTIEAWIYPKSIDTGKYFLSFATSSNFNCLLLQAAGFATANEWHHVVVTYDRHVLSIHDNGELNMRLLVGEYCGDYTGSLVFGQEQDSLGGEFTWSQGAPMLLDTVAIYSRAFDESERTTTGKTCVDMTDPNLVNLWSGYSRGADQIGTAQADLYFEKFAEGAVGNGSCSNLGVGHGTPGPSYKRYENTHVSPAVGAVGWVFPGGDTIHHFMVPDFELPLDWTIETWVYPLNATTGTYFLSFATETNNNCFVVKSWFWDEPRQWYHVVFTWDGVGALIYVNGTLQESFRFAEFCGQYRGSLSLGQEQDSVGGTFDANQSPAMILDTVAVYSRAWSQDKVEQREDSPCVNLGDADLYALYTGFSRGKDLVGSQDGSVTASEILTPGQALTDSYKYWNGEIDFTVDSCAAAQQEAGAVAPTYDTSIVGGVGWDFNGDTTAYYFITQNDFVLPEDFTIEFWMFPRRTKGYVMSWASSDNQNCLLLRNDRISMLNSWHHIVVTVSKNAAFDYTTKVYVNGTVSNFLHSSFCGNHTGALALAQEQDAVGGRFDPNQATDAIIDTLAIYNTAWDASRVGTDRTVGVDLQATDLYALYSGYTKGQDLVGHQDGIVWIPQFAEGMYNSDANVNTLDMLSPYSVGGVAWDFPAGSTDYYLQTPNMTLPADGWAIELWVSLNSLDTSGYFLSYCVTAECNCLITTMAGFTSADVGEWRHFVVTYDPDTQTTYAYLDGVENADFVHVGFCGDAGPGTLSVAQEQDVQGGGYELVDAADILIDTIAIYDTYWTPTQVNSRKGQCVNLHDTSLFTLWSGYTRGKDLVGFNDASMSIYDWAEGATLACDTFN